MGRHATKTAHLAAAQASAGMVQGAPVNNTLSEQLRALSRHEHSDASIGTDAADEFARMRARIESLRGLCKTAVGMLHDAGSTAEADQVQALIGDMEPTL